MMIIGLTGGICCGKSTVSQHFAELSAPIIDADDIAYELVKPGLSASVDSHHSSWILPHRETTIILSFRIVIKSTA